QAQYRCWVTGAQGADDEVVHLRRVLDGDQMRRDRVEPAHRVCRRGPVLEQAALKLRIDPGPSDDLRPDMRADPGLEILDDLVEGGRVDIALLGQDRFERLHPELHFGEFGAVIVSMVICWHGETLSCPGCTGSHSGAPASTSRRRMALGRARG